MTEPYFFSLIVPAHNEEHYLPETLECLRALAYPPERFEVLVVENGSTDRTLEIAHSYAGGAVRVLRSGKGVSRAKNAGVDAANPAGDWVVFLDADTRLFPRFLSELNEFLRARPRAAAGTAALLPMPDSPKARRWFAFYDWGHRVTKASYALQVIKRGLFPPLRFDETLVMGEDLQVLREALQHGEFFFFPKKEAATSTRRFEATGWWRLFFFWMFVAVLPQRLQRRFTYKEIR